MPGAKSFAWSLTWRVLFLLLTLVSIAALIARTDFVMLPGVIALAAVVATFDLYHFVRRTNRELARFVGGLRYGDVSQSFAGADRDAGFAELADSLSEAMGRLRSSRSAQEEQARYLRGLVDHVPIPLLAVYPDESFELINNAARRLLGMPRGTRLSDLTDFGERFVHDLRTVKVGDHKLTQIEQDGVRQALTLSATQIATTEGVQRIISLQNIQRALDETEYVVWRDLVRVLTHEIMNSITPVASLASTARAEIDDAIGHLGATPELTDARDAVVTVARRSDALMTFVNSYRQLTRVPPPQREIVRLSALCRDVARVFAAEWPIDQVPLTIAIDPETLEVFADRTLLEQVLINLLRNAAQAATSSTAAARIWLSARLNRRGRVFIEVRDNGPGIPAEIANEIFLPFFTTKEDGTGVGLSLARQIILAHGGSITAGNASQGGAVVTITF